jgi:hypothetical protein
MKVSGRYTRITAIAKIATTYTYSIWLIGILGDELQLQMVYRPLASSIPVNHPSMI